MSDAFLRLAVLGDPLDFTRSPELHRAGLAALGLAGDSVALRTPVAELGRRLAELAEGGYHGTSLTAPLKEAALERVARVSERAVRARSINTVGFDAHGSWGDTTDGDGFVRWIRTLGRSPQRERVFFLGAGGAARSLALAFVEAGAPEVTASARRPEAAAESWRGIPAVELVSWRSPGEAERLARASLVVHATPIRDADPVSWESLGPRALLVDLGYGPEPTPWVRRARARGFEAYDGLGLLVFQAHGALTLWTGREPPLDPLARAVGWPR